MSHNPFDANTRSFPGLFDDDEQQSLWPSRTEVPPGRREPYAAASRTASREYGEQIWTGIRSKSGLAVTG